MATEIELMDGGAAQYMGDDVFVLTQHDADAGPQNVVVSRSDLERLLAAV